MVGVVHALQLIAGDDVPEVADAELGIEFDQGPMRFLYHGPVRQLESEVLHHLRDSRLYVPGSAPRQLRHWRGRYRVVAVIADCKAQRLVVAQCES
ncbi:hypothetical protein D3C72_1163750 [compost metagenome]